MGYAKLDDPRPSADEESLPLYDESEAALHIDLSAPEDRATPDEVRDFLVALMRRRGCGIDQSRRVAANWNVGTGRELRTYPVSMYRDIFPSEDAWVLWKEVHTLYYEKEAREHPVRRWRPAIIFACSVLLFSACVLVFVYGQDTMLVIPAMFLGLFSSGSAVASGVLTCVFISQSPEKQAEQELQNGWNRATSTPSQGN